jgi:hypothetical protein
MFYGNVAEVSYDRLVNTQLFGMLSWWRSHTEEGDTKTRFSSSRDDGAHSWVVTVDSAPPMYFVCCIVSVRRRFVPSPLLFPGRLRTVAWCRLHLLHVDVEFEPRINSTPGSDLTAAGGRSRGRGERETTPMARRREAPARTRRACCLLVGRRRSSEGKVFPTGRAVASRMDWARRTERERCSSAHRPPGARPPRPIVLSTCRRAVAGRAHVARVDLAPARGLVGIQIRSSTCTRVRGSCSSNDTPGQASKQHPHTNIPP